MRLPPVHVVRSEFKASARWAAFFLPSGQCRPRSSSNEAATASSAIATPWRRIAGAKASSLLRYHGDFDWPGLRIANHVMRTWEARPWRFMAGDYEAAATDAPHARHDLDGAGATASWDDALAPAMRRHGVAIAEEAVAASLLEDLGRHLW